MRIIILIASFLLTGVSVAQSGVITGKVTNKEGEALQGVSIQAGGGLGTTTDSAGVYSLSLKPAKYTLVFSSVGYRLRRIQVNVNPGASVKLDIKLKTDITQLEDVEVTDSLAAEQGVVSVQKIDAKSAQNLPSAFGDFSKVLVTLPGVISNNEFSSGYSVRGGNFDENLVYINEIPVYRPFLSNAGRQEGLSIVNPNMVEDIRFFAGGWEARYGDKLSSSLNILYKVPEETSGTLSVGLLGGSATFEHEFSERADLLIGIRHRDSRYLLGATEIDGQYFPRYSDIQSLINFDLRRKESNRINRTKLTWFNYYGRNRYLTLPESQSTVFGSVVRNFRIETAFEGREILDYDVYQSGLNLSHLWTENWLSRWIVSGVYTREREFYDVEGAYRLCDIDQQFGSTTFNECVVVRGVGSNYRYGRNQLEAIIGSFEWRNEHIVGKQMVFEWGAGIQFRDIQDEINEYAFADSADFVELQRSVFNELSLISRNYSAYAQQTFFSGDSSHAFNAGVRFNYWDVNNQLLISPRFTYQYKPGADGLTTLHISAGLYQQFPFYRELRTAQGLIRPDARAQRSVHLIAGIERTTFMWGRPFKLSAEAYYKWLYDLIPYEIDNVRLRYLDQNDAFGYAAGLDLRINGEFIPGTQSWISLGLLTTQENIAGDNRGYIRRPFDQWVNLAIYFEDHVPNDPTIRVYLNLVYGSGFPTGPPNDLRNRNRFQGDEYYRADLGLSKIFFLRDRWLKNIQLRLEVLNALAADNTLSYNWIEDVNGTQFAIPNSLSARFLNIKLTTEF